MQQGKLLLEFWFFGVCSEGESFSARLANCEHKLKGECRKSEGNLPSGNNSQDN